MEVINVVSSHILTFDAYLESWAVGCSSAPILNDYGGDREDTSSHN